MKKLTKIIEKLNFDDSIILIDDPNKKINAVINQVKNISSSLQLLAEQLEEKEEKEKEEKEKLETKLKDLEEKAKEKEEETKSDFEEKIKELEKKIEEISDIVKDLIEYSEEKERKDEKEAAEEITKAVEEIMEEHLRVKKHNQRTFSTIYELLEAINQDLENNKKIIHTIYDILKTLITEKEDYLTENIRKEDSRKTRQIHKTIYEALSAMYENLYILDKRDRVQYQILNEIYKILKEQVEEKALKPLEKNKSAEEKLESKSDLSKKIDEILSDVKATEFVELEDKSLKKEEKETKIEPTKLTIEDLLK